MVAGRCASSANVSLLRQPGELTACEAAELGARETRLELAARLGDASDGGEREAEVVSVVEVRRLEAIGELERAACLLGLSHRERDLAVGAVTRGVER